jgi:hypothetical protein
MVKGLAVFRDHFKDYTGLYVLIGGTACDLLMEDAELPFRATKDLDMVLCVEALDDGFIRHFWDFIRMGGYALRQKGEAGPSFYRFTKPADAAYPQMLELFSRKPDAVNLQGSPEVTPIPAGEEASSLSAILLDDVCYAFLLDGATEVQGVRLASATRLIPLKALAWSDLARKKAAGAEVDSRDIRKHANDIYRLSQLLNPADTVSAPGSCIESLRELIRQKTIDPPDLKALGVSGLSLAQIHQLLQKVYSL